MDLLTRIQEKRATVCVVGLGYVGLPLAMEMVKKGFKVIGVNRGQEKVEQLLRGESYIIDVSDAEVKAAVESGRFSPTTDYAAIKDADTVSICVPTPLRKTKDPDVTFITASMEQMKPYLHDEMLIVLESTTYPGTTDELVRDEIEAMGYKVGENFFVAFSPERVDPGNQRYQTGNTPKIIGGTTPRCTEMAVALYGNTVDTIVPVSSTRAAEMAKLLENTFRSVNIALVNEMALLCERMDIDIWEVIDAAATKPFGFMPFYPGPGIGGHCIPLDPAYLSWKAKTFNFYHRFIELASDINGNMPRYVVGKIGELLNKHQKCINGSRILILGMAYKKDIDDLRESPALEIFYMLEEAGGLVEFGDELVGAFQHRDGEERTSVSLAPEALAAYDIAILTTNHSYFDYEMIAERAQLVYDTRNAFREILPFKGKGNIFKL
jgi:UDP-N-acetyl-D-glucosamine dehydrogenase